MQDIDETLIARGQRYGKFEDQACIAQWFKNFMRDTAGWQRMDYDQREALEMIQTKLSRLLNGDPDYHDTWHDIAGYAKLVADRLEGVAR